MRSLAVFAITLMLSASASASVLAAGNTCFYGRSVDSFEVKGRDTLVVRDMGREYQVRLNFCSGLRWADRIGFESFSSWVCRGDKVLLIDAWGRVQDRCWIDDITQIR
ncbi:MAG: DUF6491 family protein [Bdellovibrionota bacterium]